MRSKTHTILNGIIWIVVAAVGILIVLSMFDDGGGAIAGLATVLALTGILWVPVVFVISLIAFVLEVRFVRREQRRCWMLLRAPSTYVLLAMAYLLSVIFLG